MSKGVKIGLIVGAVLLAIIVLYYLFKGSSAAVKWTVYSNNDAYGNDIDYWDTTKTLDEAKEHAIKINAAGFSRTKSGDRTFFKSNVSTRQSNSNLDTYVKS